MSKLKNFLPLVIVLSVWITGTSFRKSEPTSVLSQLVLRNYLSGTTVSASAQNTSTGVVYNLGPVGAGQVSTYVPDGNYNITVSTTDTFTSLKLYTGSTLADCIPFDYPYGTYTFVTANISGTSGIIMSAASCD